MNTQPKESIDQSGDDPSAQVVGPAVPDAVTVEESSAIRADTQADADQSTPQDTNEPQEPVATSDNSVSTSDAKFDIHNVKPLKRRFFPNTQSSPGDNCRLPATIANLSHMLRRYKITARYNVIDKSTQINIPGMSGCPDNADNSALTYIISLAALNGLPTGPVPMYLEAIADKHQFNPVMDYILSKPWDGEKRINVLADTLETGPDFPEKLRKTLVRKWLISAVAAAAMPSGF